jgi:hypothetical protein
MAKINLTDMALPQDILDVDDVSYTVSPLPATMGLDFMDKYRESIDSGKADFMIMKYLICNCKVMKDDKLIVDGKAAQGCVSFDVVFAKKLGHLGKLYNALLQYNFEDVFQEPDSED